MGVPVLLGVSVAVSSKFWRSMGIEIDWLRAASDADIRASRKASSAERSKRAANCLGSANMAVLLSLCAGANKGTTATLRLRRLLGASYHSGLQTVNRCFLQ